MGHGSTGILRKEKGGKKGSQGTELPSLCKFPCKDRLKIGINEIYDEKSVRI